MKPKSESHLNVSPWRNLDQVGRVPSQASHSRLPRHCSTSSPNFPFFPLLLLMLPLGLERHVPSWHPTGSCSFKKARLSSGPDSTPIPTQARRLPWDPMNPLIYWLDLVVSPTRQTSLRAGTVGCVSVPQVLTRGPHQHSFNSHFVREHPPTQNLHQTPSSVGTIV